MEAPFNIQKILEILPHRYPILLIDRILELSAGERILELKNVTINEPFFQGHFPQTPIMPGVLILEAMAQAGGVLAFASSFQKKKGLIYFMAIDKVRFRAPVVPGDQLICEMKIVKLKTKVVKMIGVATVNKKKVAEAEFVATLGEK
jgi:3-hydroxyacyl-[acyl-carrier-protein] dehydratase